MAGSLADFKYTTDDGDTYLLRIDRSNASLPGTGFEPITDEDLSTPYLPRNIEPRYAWAQHPTRPIKRRLWIANPTAPIWTGEVKEVELIDYQDSSTQVFRITRRIQEKEIYRPQLPDSYQNDSPE